METQTNDPSEPNIDPGTQTKTNYIDESFTKAAIYQQCRKSNILRHIDLKDAEVGVMRDLINRENLLSLRKLPIIFSKFVVKTGLEFACDKFPKAGKFIQPKHIRVDVEDDEMEFLLATNSSFKPNLVFIVTKNIALGVLGDSVSALRTKMMDFSYDKAKNGNDADNDKNSEPTIRINSPKSDPMRFTPPKTFTTILGDPMSPRSGTIKPLKRLNSSRNSVASSKSSRRSTLSSSKTSVKSAHSKRSDVQSNGHLTNTEIRNWVNNQKTGGIVVDEPLVEKIHISDCGSDYDADVMKSNTHVRQESPHKEQDSATDIRILENTVLNTLNDIFTESPEDWLDGASKNAKNIEVSLPLDRDDGPGYDDKKENDRESCYSAMQESENGNITGNNSVNYDTYDDYDNGKYFDDHNDDEDNDDGDVDMSEESEPSKITQDNLKPLNMQPNTLENLSNVLDLVSVKTENPVNVKKRKSNNQFRGGSKKSKQAPNYDDAIFGTLLRNSKP